MFLSVIYGEAFGFVCGKKTSISNFKSMMVAQLIIVCYYNSFFDKKVISVSKLGGQKKKQKKILKKTEILTKNQH